MEWVLEWERAAATGPGICGGKGWNLGRLHRYGFPVPVGGVLAAAAYTAFMADPTLQPLQAELAGVPAAAAATPAVADQLSALRTAIGAAALPTAVAAGVQAFLTGSGLAGVPVAVRSSATAEDSVIASFAGIHRSLLHVRGEQAVLQAIKDCYASLWTPQALAYRRRLGLQDDEVACAVVICAMVGEAADAPPAAAGVAFSCDPRSGRRDQITISAAPGLGEAVVSGSVNPEEITLTLARGELHLTGRIGRPDQVLSDDRALELARLTLRVHWALGEGQDPQDVEWAFAGQRFWLLQARPVTRLPRVTFPEVAQLPVVWSNANLKDAVAGVQSTLGWSVLQDALRYILHAPQDAVGYPVPPGLETARLFSGRAYFDLTSVVWAGYDAFGITPAEMNRNLGGHQPEIPVPPGNPRRGRRGWSRQRRLLRLVRVLLRIAREFPADIARAMATSREMRTLDLTGRSGPELLALLHQIGRVQEHLGPRFQLANTGPTAWLTYLEAVLNRVAPERAKALAAALMAGSGEVTSAEHGYRLFDLVAAAGQDPAARTYLQREPLDPHGWRQLPADSPFRAAFAQFLEEFGHRGVYEVEMANPRWNEDPTYLLEQVRLLLNSAQTRPPRNAARATRAAAEAEVSRRTWLLRPLIRWLAARARQAAALREAGKSAMVAPLEFMRRLALEIGRRLVAAGQLDDPAAIFYLAAVDGEMVLRGEWDGTGARALVADRQAQRARWLTESPPDVMVLDAAGRPAELPTTPAAIAPATAPRPAQPGQPGELAGIGVASGRATVQARIIHHPTEGHRLQPGDILIAPSTDPGWTPLFLRAAAVVMEVGGYLSHGAIVAREYGIPAVVNIPGLLKTVQDGQRLVVDGDTGRVWPEQG